MNVGVTTSHHQNRPLPSELAEIIETSYDGIVIADADGTIVLVNRAYERITGFPREKILNRRGRDLVEQGIFSDYLADRILESRKPTMMIQQYSTGRSAVVVGSPLLDGEGNIKRMVFNVRDVTELTSLREQLDKTLQTSERYQVEVQQLRAEQGAVADVVVVSRQMRHVIDRVLAVARVGSTVLFLGESGVGKSRLARILHDNSPRADGPFITVNCAALPEGLLEAEMFGYEGGAFTGARRDGKPGLIELANGGTLFLDEIAELPAPVQAKLLHLVQEREFRRVGGTAVHRVDVRLVAATNRDLEQRVRAGQFREDLYYRLNVVPIHIPPLRERSEDVLALLTQFLQRLADRYGMKKRFSNEALTRLLAYPWPGNTRELENVVERLVVTTPREVIEVDDLPPAIAGTGETAQPGIAVHSLMPVNQAVAAVERQLYQLAARALGSTRKVAQALGVSQATAARRLKQYLGPATTYSRRGVLDDPREDEDASGFDSQVNH